jgi:hypothetical protein
MDDFLLLYAHFPADFWCKDTHFPLLSNSISALLKQILSQFNYSFDLGFKNGSFALVKN